MPAVAFDDSELERLAAFRAVARQVRDASIIDGARTVKITITGHKRGEPIDADRLAQARERSAEDKVQRLDAVCVRPLDAGR